MKFDMHCHTSEGSSDGHVSIEKYIELLRQQGFDGMLVTDHDSYGGYRHWKKNKKKMPADFVVLKGIEYDTIDAGHMIVVLPSGKHLGVLEHRGLPVEELIRIVHEFGGIIGPAHPCGEPFLSALSTGIYKRKRKIVEQFDFIEAFNCGEDEEANAKAAAIAKEFSKPATAGSDSHKPDCVGLAYTIFDGDIYNEDDLIAYIKNGNPTEYGGERYLGTIKEHLGKWNKLLVYGFFPYNKFGAMVHMHKRHLELAHIYEELRRSGREKNIPAFAYITELMMHKKIKEMEAFIQHGKINTLEHCTNVARTSDKLSRALRLKGIDKRKMLRAAMLHDFYLYDWHYKDGGVHRWHGFNHAERARRNAVKYFNVSKKEQDIISSHMWPLNITKFPMCREAWLVCLADKIEATKETLLKRK